MSEAAAIEVEDLRAFYGEPHRLARDKVLPRLDRHCRDFIARSPFLVLGTADAQVNQDVSPRGDPPGLVKVLADGRLAIPDRPGNRRVDSLTNTATNPKVALLFMVVEVEEAFFHCAKAFVRSALWNPASRADRSQMPTLGGIIADQIKGVDAVAADAVVDDDIRHNLY